MRIGIIGGGQLGMMLGTAAKTQNIECEFLDPNPESPARSTGSVLTANYDDRKALRELASRCDVLSYEFENVPVDALRELTEDTAIPVHPALNALEAAQDRLAEKRLFEALGIPLPGYQTIDSKEDVYAAVERLGCPLLIKTRRFGYDGKGQARATNPREAAAGAASLGGKGLIAEAYVTFDFEVSAIATRSVAGDIAYYGLTENRHNNGILDTSIAPCLQPTLDALARSYIERILRHFEYVGTLALELFVSGDSLLVNEFAPRVHNSGHWTIEGTACSQFENHIRAIAGLELGNPAARGFSAMKNIIGNMPRGLDDIGFAKLHNYGKSERPGRKLAHVTVNAPSASQRDQQLEQLRALIDVS